MNSDHPPPQDWAVEVLGSWNWVIPLFVFISAFGTLHASLFASGRQVDKDLSIYCRLSIISAMLLLL